MQQQEPPEGNSDLGWSELLSVSDRLSLSRRRRSYSYKKLSGSASEKCLCWEGQIQIHCLQCQLCKNPVLQSNSSKTIIFLAFSLRSRKGLWESLCHGNNLLLFWLPFKLIYSYLFLHYSLKRMADIAASSEPSEEENFWKVYYKLYLLLSTWRWNWLCHKGYWQIIFSLKPASAGFFHLPVKTILPLFCTWPLYVSAQSLRWASLCLSILVLHTKSTLKTVWNK